MTTVIIISKEKGSFYLSLIGLLSYIGISVTISIVWDFRIWKPQCLSIVRVVFRFRFRNLQLETLRLFSHMTCIALWLAFIPQLHVLKTFIYHCLEIYFFHSNCSILLLWMYSIYFLKHIRSKYIIPGCTQRCLLRKYP